MNNEFSFEHRQYKTIHYRANPRGIFMHYLTYIQKGHCGIETEGKTISAKEGDVFFIPKGVPYKVLWEGDEETGRIDFLSYGFFHLHTADSFDFLPQRIDCSPALIKRISEIPAEGNLITCKALSLFYGVMTELLPLMEHAGNKDTLIVEKARKFIYSNFNCTMAEVAEACYISQPYLYKIFKRQLHIAPNEFKRKILCEKGIELLNTTDKTVEEISSILGLSSGSYFRKILKRYTARTPKEIREVGMLYDIIV